MMRRYPLCNKSVVERQVNDRPVEDVMLREIRIVGL